MTAWIVVIGAGLATVTLKGAGPLLLGGRSLPVAVTRVLVLLAPAMLAALVVTQTFTSEGSLTVDARALGVAAAAVALLLRAPVLVVIVVAAAVTALARLVA